MSIFNCVGWGTIKQSGPNNNTFTKHGDDKASAYGSKWFHTNTDDVYSLNIKINRMPGYIYFGMVTDKHHQKTDKFFSAIYSIAVNLWNGDVYVNDHYSQSSRGPKCYEGDIVRLIIDCKKNLFFALKNNDPKQYQLPQLTEMQNSKHIKFRMALYMKWAQNSVTVECADNDEIVDDFKENSKERESEFEKERVKLLNNSKTSQMISLQSQNEELNNKCKSMQNKIYSLQKQQNESKKKSFEMMQKIEELKHQNKRIEREKNEKTSQITILQKENKSLNDVNISLEEDKKENVILINKLKKENDKLKFSNLNISNWRQWNSEQIVFWMKSLNPKIYGQYEDVLSVTLKEENVNGECLGIVDMNDLKNWGIVNFMHRKTMFKHIQQLIANKQENNKNNQNEGTYPPTAYL